jgi:hypothetical protein
MTFFGERPADATVADFDGDGIADVAFCAGKDLGFARGTPDGPAAPAILALGSATNSDELPGDIACLVRPLAAGPATDLVAAWGEGTVARVPFVSGSPSAPVTAPGGHFYTESQANVLYRPRGAADVDGDGLLDLLAIQKASAFETSPHSFVMVWRADPQQLFAVPRLLQVPGHDACTAPPGVSSGEWVFGPVAAFDFDGKPGDDLLCGNGLLLSLGTEGIETRSVGGPAGTLADLDGDGRPEVIGVEGNTLQAWTVGTESSTLLASADWPPGAADLRLLAADLDGDGDDELGIPHAGTITLFDLNGSGELAHLGAFLYPGEVSANAGAWLAGPLDWEGDGARIAVCIHDRLFLYDPPAGDGSDAPPSVTTDLALSDCFARDLDGDDQLDLAGRLAGEGPLTGRIGLLRSSLGLYPGNLRQTQIPAWAVDSHADFAVGDATGDGQADLVFGGILLPLDDDGDLPRQGLASRPYDYGDDYLSDALTLADVDGDGGPDILYGDGRWRPVPAAGELVEEELRESGGCPPGKLSAAGPFIEGVGEIQAVADGNVLTLRMYSPLAKSCETLHEATFDNGLSALYAGPGNDLHVVEVGEDVWDTGGFSTIRRLRFSVGEKDGKTAVQEERSRMATVPCRASHVAGADFNADGSLDFAVLCEQGELVADLQHPHAEWKTTTLRIVSREDAPTPVVAVDWVSPVEQPARLLADDLNGDGRPDVLVVGRHGIAASLQQ